MACRCDECMANRANPPEDRLVRPGTSIRVAKRDSLNYKEKDLYYLPPASVVTQKARGIKALRSAPYKPAPGTGKIFDTAEAYKSPFERQPVLILPQMPIPADYFDAGTAFARPCPTVPRHGFVESRSVNSVTEVRKVFAAARKEDPQAEVVLMPKLTGNYSAVATNAGVSWGGGHDGVTAGKSGSIAIPTPTTGSAIWNQQISYSLGKRMDEVGVKNTAYLELVEHRTRTYVVQVRDGPEQPTTKNYIPHAVKVERVLRSVEHPDLLGWEKRLKHEVETNGTKGLIIKMPEGSALTSHHAVHGIQMGIPVITEGNYYGLIGKLLEPTNDAVPPLREDVYRHLASTLERHLEMDYLPWTTYAGERVYFDSTEFPLLTAIGTAHAMTQWGDHAHLHVLRTSSLVTLARYTTAACLGELRHWNTSGPGARRSKKRVTSLTGVIYDRGRVSIYEEMYKPHPASQLACVLESARRDFLTPGWNTEDDDDPRRDGNGSYGYGGPKWAEVAASGLRLVRAMEDFISTPNENRWSDCVLAANSVVHVAHNGGRALNKWVSDWQFKVIGNAPALGFCNPFAAEIALRLHHLNHY